MRRYLQPQLYESFPAFVHSIKFPSPNRPRPSHSISGGTISGGLFFFFSTPSEAGLFANDTSVVNIFGTAFNLPFSTITASSGILTGSLAYGSSINSEFTRRANATIILHQVIPEPTSIQLIFCATAVLYLRRLRQTRQ
jgi:hypothetical protein